MEETKDLLDYLGGGWLSLVLAIVLGLFFGYLKHAEKKAKREGAQRDTDLNRAKDQAEIANSNSQTQADWDKASDDIDKIRAEHEKNKGGVK